MGGAPRTNRTQKSTERVRAFRGHDNETGNTVKTGQQLCHPNPKGRLS
jgi:hypothetical protein